MRKRVALGLCGMLLLVLLVFCVNYFKKDFSLEDIGNIYLLDEDGCSYAYYQRAGQSYMVESRDTGEHSLIYVCAQRIQKKGGSH